LKDLAAALAHYRALGFEARSYDSEYGFADRDGLSLHLAVNPEHDPAHAAASAYLYVRDADVSYQEWSQPGIGGRTHTVVKTPTSFARARMSTRTGTSSASALRSSSEPVTWPPGSSSRSWGWWLSSLVAA